MTDERPPMTHAATSATSATLQTPQHEDQPDRVGEKSDLQSEPGTNDDLEQAALPDPPPTSSRPSIHDFLLLFGICVMLIWPWIFFGAVWAKKGIQMDNHIARVVRDNPQATTYFVTLICSIISMIVTAFFSLAIIRFAQELVTRYRPTRPFHLRVLLAIRHQSWPWGKTLKDAKELMKRDKWWPVVLVVICLLTFPHLVSTTTSLISPIPFNRTATLTGTELNFAATDATCVNWFRGHPIPNTCDWATYKGQNYTTCPGANQMVDVLEAGRGNILELISNNTQSLTFSQLSGNDGLHFLGSIRGVLPIGPDGVPAFNTLAPSPFTNPEIMAGVTSYNYTLDHQGLLSNISCSYQPTSPIVFTPTSNFTGNYRASCTSLGESEILTGVNTFSSVNGTNTLTYWACQSAPSSTQATSYSIYLRGLGFYEENIGNITCTVSPVGPALYPVTYQSTPRIFTTGEVVSSANESLGTSSSVFSVLAYNTLIGLGGVISSAQNFDSNLVSESVFTFGVKSFGQPWNQATTEYLRLYERMIQGILEYETTYIRLIYSSVPPPTSCYRTVTGSARLEVLGWHVTNANIGFLIPLTIINGAALISLILAMTFAKVVGYLHPRHARKVTYDSNYEEEVPDEWKEKVSFQPTTILKEHFDGQLKDTLVQGGKEAATATAMQTFQAATK